MSPKHYNSVNGTNKLPIRTVFKNSNCNAFHRLITVPNFFVRSLRYTASYRHGYLDLIEGTGVGDYSSSGGRGREKYNFSRFLPNRRARPLSSFNTHARWQPVTQSARSRWSYGKNRGLWTVYAFHSSLNLSICDFFCICCVILTQSGDQFRIPKQTFKNKNKNTICFLPLLIVDTTPTEHVKTGLTKLSIQWAEKTFLYPRFTY